MPAMSIRARVSGWPYARKSSSSTTAASGWNPSRGRVRPFISPFPRRSKKMVEETSVAQRTRPVEILLVEDQAGDAYLVQKFFKGSRIPNHVSLVADGERALDF